MKRVVYIHIPFCKTICSYCDFCKMFYDQKWSRKYLIKLKEEIDDLYNGEEVKSIYVGGGTPSVLPRSELLFLMETVKVFKRSLNCEFTFECNVDDITEELLSILKRYRVNRLSIGVQSFQKDNQHILGRHHEFSDVESKMALIREYGFKNVNLDLIYAVPGETVKMLRDDLRLYMKLKPDHISTYSLMIEPNTLLWKEKIRPIPEEIDEDMYMYICSFLARKGYGHYEISNFALEGKESHHNLTYWDNEEYYGFGLGASGYLDQIRYTNTKSLTKYLSGEFRDVQELLSEKDIMDNEMMLGFRKIKGICIKDFEEKYHVKMEDVYPIKPLLKNGDLEEKKGYIYIPKEKLYVMNEILLKMI